MKPYNKLRDELHVVNMDKTSQERFDWWKIEYNAMIHKRVWDDIYCGKLAHELLESGTV